jgi:hypothetical protein
VLAGSAQRHEHQGLRGWRGAAIMLVVAFPIALITLLLGLLAVLVRRGRGWALAASWMASAVGGIGLIPAFGATLAGLADSVFYGFILFG